MNSKEDRHMRTQIMLEVEGNHTADLKPWAEEMLQKLLDKGLKASVVVNLNLFDASRGDRLDGS
jgi:hypothetical protein